MYRTRLKLQDGREYEVEHSTIEEASVWKSNAILKTGATEEEFDGPTDISDEIAQTEAERAELDNDFGELKSTVLSRIDDGTLFSSLSNAEKRVIKTLVRLIRR